MAAEITDCSSRRAPGGLLASLARSALAWPRTWWVQVMTAKSRQSAGMPLSSCLPRSSNVVPDPATRSTTVRDTRTSPGCAVSQTRHASWTAMPASSVPRRSTSPVWIPTGTSRPIWRAASRIAVPHGSLGRGRRRWRVRGRGLPLRPEPRRRIHDNRIVFNYAFDEGGGVMVGGELRGELGQPGSGLSLGSGPVTVERNEIRGNVSNDDGGGIRLLSPVQWKVRTANNLVVDNLATDLGGGISLDDALDVDIVNNTVAHNVTTATSEDADISCNTQESFDRRAGAEGPRLHGCGDRGGRAWTPASSSVTPISQLAGAAARTAGSTPTASVPRPPTSTATGRGRWGWRSAPSPPAVPPAFDLRGLRAAGILPVFAAGNFGPGGSTSTSPANYPKALRSAPRTSATRCTPAAGAGRRRAGSPPPPGRIRTCVPLDPVRWSPGSGHAARRYDQPRRSDQRTRAGHGVRRHIRRCPSPIPLDPVTSGADRLPGGIHRGHGTSAVAKLPTSMPSSGSLEIPVEIRFR